MSYRLAVSRHSTVRIARTVADIREAKADGVAALLLHAQGGEWVGGNLHRLAAFHELGLRMMLPA